MRVLNYATTADGAQAGVPAACSTRGMRLAARLTGRSLPRFDDLAGIAAWRLVSPAQADELAVTTALLFHRPQIDRAVDGASLRAIAKHVGERLFDLACGAPVEDVAASTVSKLPHATHYRDIGLSLIKRAEQGRESAVVRLLDRAAALIVRPLP